MYATLGLNAEFLLAVVMAMKRRMVGNCLKHRFAMEAPYTSFVVVIINLELE